MTPIEALRVLTRAVDIYGNVDADDVAFSRDVWMKEIVPAMEVAHEVCERHDRAQREGETP